MQELSRQLQGYRLTTAEILYHLPDYPDLLQSYIWQEYDLCPRFPQLHRFLGYWETHIEGRMHPVQVMHAELVRPALWRPVDHSWTLH